MTYDDRYELFTFVTTHPITVNGKRIRVWADVINDSVCIHVSNTTVGYINTIIGSINAAGKTLEEVIEEYKQLVNLPGELDKLIILGI